MSKDTHTPRGDSYDMQRKVTASFEPCPPPEPVEQVPWRTFQQHANGASDDPAVAQMKGIVDTTERDRGDKKASRSAK